MNIEEKLNVFRLQFIVLNKIQQDTIGIIERTFWERGTLPGCDSVTLKEGDSFVFADKHGTFFQKNAKGKKTYIEYLMRTTLSTFSTEQIQLMRKQIMIDKVQYKIQSEFLKFLRTIKLYSSSTRVYPIGMFVNTDDIMIYGSHKPDVSSTDIFCTLSYLTVSE